VVLLLGAYAAGRYATPARVVEKVRTVEVEKVVERVRMETVYRAAQDERRNVRRETREEKRPDGTVITTKVEDDKTETKTATEGRTAAEAAKAVERERLVETVRVVEGKRPDWLVGAQIGYSNGALYGVSVDRRILGPAYIGVWANTQRAVGVGIRVQF
jgi:hypothetical protein